MKCSGISRFCTWIVIFTKQVKIEGKHAEKIEKHRTEALYLVQSRSAILAIYPRVRCVLGMCTCIWTGSG